MSIRKDEEGFTLVELLVAIVVLGFIVAALGSAVISIVKNSNITSQRLTESHDAQIAAAYFANDVQSADVSGTVAPTVLTGRACDNGYTPVTDSVSGKPLRLGWTEQDVTGTVTAYKVVVYATQAVSGGPSVLHRLFCKGSSYSDPSFGLVSDLVISHNVLAIANPPSVSASISPCAAGTAQTATLTVTETSNSYTFRVGGTRREQTC